MVLEVQISRLEKSKEAKVGQWENGTIKDYIVINDDFSNFAQVLQTGQHQISEEDLQGEPGNLRPERKLDNRRQPSQLRAGSGRRLNQLEVHSTNYSGRAAAEGAEERVERVNGLSRSLEDKLVHA